MNQITHRRGNFCRNFPYSSHCPNRALSAPQRPRRHRWHLSPPSRPPCRERLLPAARNNSFGKPAVRPGVPIPSRLAAWSEEGQPRGCGFSPFPPGGQSPSTSACPGTVHIPGERLATNAWTPILAQRRGFHAFPVEIAKNAPANYRALPGQVHF